MKDQQFESEERGAPPDFGNSSFKNESERVRSMSLPPQHDKTAVIVEEQKSKSKNLTGGLDLSAIQRNDTTPEPNENKLTFRNENLDIIEESYQSHTNREPDDE